MNAQAYPALAVRPMLAQDAPMLADIFRQSILELTGDDYTDAQQESWAAAVDDEADFARRLARELTIIASLEGEPVGFASLESNDKIGFLYVHPAAARQGVGTLLSDALEKIAAAHGVDTLSVEASDTASEFFAKRGYVPQQRNSVKCGTAWLANTTMHKALATAREAAR